MESQWLGGAEDKDRFWVLSVVPNILKFRPRISRASRASGGRDIIQMLRPHNIWYQIRDPTVHVAILKIV